MRQRLPTNSLSPRVGSLLDEIVASTGFDSSAALDALLNPPTKDIFATAKRKSWDKTVEARCDFSPKPRMTPRAGVWFLSLWQKSVKGKTLTEIKEDESEVERFATAVANFISEFLGDSLIGWAIVTTPKRRHKTRNFASLVAAKIGSRLNIPFVEDVAICRSKERINAVFELMNEPPQENLIVFDDFVTTGSTLKSMDNLLRPLGKTIVYVAGINNKL